MEGNHILNIEVDVGRRKADVDHYCLAGHSLKGEFDAHCSGHLTTAMHGARHAGFGVYMCPDIQLRLPDHLIGFYALQYL